MYKVYALIFAAIELGYIILLLNRFIRHRQAIAEARSDILVQLERRNAVLVQIVPVIAANKDHEAEVFERVAAIRAASTQKQFTLVTANEAALRQSLTGMITVEALPRLKTDASFRALMDELVDMEDDIQGARLLLNRAIQQYNSRIHVLPDLLLAKTCGYTPAAFFEVPELDLDAVRQQAP